MNIVIFIFLVLIGFCGRKTYDTNGVESFDAIMWLTGTFVCTVATGILIIIKIFWV